MVGGHHNMKWYSIQLYYRVTALTERKWKKNGRISVKQTPYGTASFSGCIFCTAPSFLHLPRILPPDRDMAKALASCLS